MKVILRGGPCDGQIMHVPDKKHEVKLYSVPPIDIERIRFDDLSDGVIKPLTTFFYQRALEIENDCVVFIYDEGT
jgi:hypothetical protein